MTDESLEENASPAEDLLAAIVCEPDAQNEIAFRGRQLIAAKKRTAKAQWAQRRS